MIKPWEPARAPVFLSACKMHAENVGKVATMTPVAKYIAEIFDKNYRTSRKKYLKFIRRTVMKKYKQKHANC